MIDVKRDFNDRVNEIELYFSFIENIVLKEAKLIYPDNTIEVLSSDLSKILKANSFLLLYNLSESCIKNAIEKIYTTLNNEGVSYDDLISSIKIEIIKFLKNNTNPKDFAENINSITYDIIMKCFDSEKVLSGNLDAKKVKDLALRYGFSSSILPIVNLDGTRTPIDTMDILVVKNKRNDLAHGIYSFKECGKEYTPQDLIRIKNNVIAYLRQILDNIETYIIDKDYLTTII